MGFKTMSTKQPTGRRGNAGFTIVELMVVSAISLFVMAALAAVTFHTSRSLAELANYADLDQQSRLALDSISNKIRHAEGVVSYTSSKLVLDTGSGSTRTFEHFPATRELKETYGNLTKTVLKGCDVLEVDVFQRSTASGTFNQFAHVAGTNEAKVVQISWFCSRDGSGVTRTTENVQSAKIVIRN